MLFDVPAEMQELVGDGTQFDADTRTRYDMALCVFRLPEPI